MPDMEQNSINLNSADLIPDRLAGMNAAAAREYILAAITTLKLTEKELRSLEEDAAKWKGRMELARSRGMEDLRKEAEAEAEKADTKISRLREEERSLKERITAMQRQLPGIAARERSIDPDLLEQELLMAIGKTGDEP